MDEILVYEHIYGLPEFLDSVNEEITECVNAQCRTVEEAEKMVEQINLLNPEDRQGRRRNLYVWRAA